MKIRAIITTILTLALALYSCQEDDTRTEIIPKQRAAFETFLSAAEYEGYREQDRVYVFVENMDRPEYPTATMAESGDNVSFFFEAYVFAAGSKRGMGGIFYTNKEEIMEQLKDLNHEYWDKNARETTLGEGSLIEGLNRGLLGCREGDSLLIYITSDLAFSDSAFANLPKDTPQVWALNIEKVKKQ